jgi:1,4-dihydroxy-2-naphthoate octaprenyltransferase
MSFLDVLRKLGIVRYGAKAGTYTSGTDRPIEFMMDDVFNGDKELTTRKDVARAAQAGEAALKRTGGRKVLFWVTVVLAALAVLFLTTAGGLSFWLLSCLALWAVILYLGYQFAYDGRFSYGGMVALVLLGLVASFFLLGATVSV